MDLRVETADYLFYLDGVGLSFVSIFMEKFLKTSVKEGNLILTFDYFNNYFQNVAYTQRIDLKADKHSGTPLFSVNYTYADKDGVDTVCFYPADASGKCVATLNGTVMGKVYEGRVKNLITQTAHAAKDDIVANLA